MKRPKAPRPAILYFIAAMLWAQALLLGVSGFIKPDRGRWWQGAIFVIFLGAIGIRFFVLAGKERMRIQRRAAGLCIKCGYDLRETPGRCPECGTVPSR